MKKLFFIGANKTGTITIRNTFMQMGVVTIHNPKWYAQSWKKDEGYFKNPSVFLDGLNCPDLAWLDKTFDAFFILNTRNIKDWAVSGWNHINRRDNNRQQKIPLNNVNHMKNLLRIRNVLHTKVLEYFDDDSPNFTVLDLPGSTPEVTLDKLKMVSGLAIPKLITGHVTKNRDTYVKNPLPVMTALKELGIHPKDYNKLILDI